jgi:NAD(P)-dependent dehydrogenase (short-subunit alcohol dehydrogenase family)
MQKGATSKKIRPPQKQNRPGIESKMKPVPVTDYPDKPGSGKLNNKVALITGGDSGIGKAVAILFAKEGADIAIAYLSETNDALDTANIIQQHYGRNCFLVKGDLSREKHCVQVIRKTVQEYGRLDILVNNAALHFESKDIRDIATSHLRKTFDTNILSFFWMTKAAMPYLKKGSCIINSSSVTAYRGSANLMDYASTKGAIVSFTRSLSASLAKKGIRVNGVAPGPVWTPLIPSSFKAAKAAKHGSDVPMQRAGQPAEIAPSYLFLACDDSSYMTGQFLHPNGGEIING